MSGGDDAAGRKAVHVGNRERIRRGRSKSHGGRKKGFSGKRRLNLPRFGEKKGPRFHSFGEDSPAGPKEEGGTKRGGNFQKKTHGFDRNAGEISGGKIKKRKARKGMSIDSQTQKPFVDLGTKTE